MSHDIIDNRRQTLVDHIVTLLPDASLARFAVGYLFLPGLEALGAQLSSLNELRLLIGNTSSRETIELLAAGRRRLELVQERLEQTRYAKRSELRRRADETASNLRETMEVMDQTDAAILDKSEHINENAMYAIYENGNAGEAEESVAEFMDINEAEEFFRRLSKEFPAEYERIRNLRDGIRSAYGGASDGFYAFCKAGRYHQLFLLDQNGTIVSRDVSRVLSVIRATPESPTCAPLPGEYNRRIMNVLKTFVREVKHRESQRDHSISLRLCQRYVLRELRILFERTDDENRKAQIAELEWAFRLAPTAAVTKELNTLRRNGVVGVALLESLSNIYHKHRLRDRLDQMDTAGLPASEIPHIVCSELLAKANAPQSSKEPGQIREILADANP